MQVRAFERYIPLKCVGIVSIFLNFHVLKRAIIKEIDREHILSFKSSHYENRN